MIYHLSNKVINMRQKVSCHHGKCFEEHESVETHFDELFNQQNIVKKIEKELWDHTLYGE